MPNYVRARVPGGCYFFTVVTKNRAPELTRDDVRAVLRTAIATTRQRWPFMIDAWVLLPDHLHCLWTLPDADADYSRRWSTIKRLTTQSLGQSIWQDRFWEHVIRNDVDFRRHLDYIHWNPVKHGHVERAIDWPWSTFHRYVEKGWYSQDWCDLSPDMDLD